MRDIYTLSGFILNFSCCGFFDVLCLNVALAQGVGALNNKPGCGRSYCDVSISE